MMPQVALARELPLAKAPMAWTTKSGPCRRLTRDIRVVDARLAALAVVSLLGGCAHEPIVWPPAPADMAPIHQAAYDDAWLRVDFVDPIAARRELGDELKLKGIVWIDDEQIIFRNRAEELLPVPAERIRGLTVKDRDRGGLIGALIGAGAGGAAILATWYLFGVIGDDSAGRGTCTACDAKFIAGVVASTALLGMIVGYWISGGRSYDFVRAR